MSALHGNLWMMLVTLIRCPWPYREVARTSKSSFVRGCGSESQPADIVEVWYSLTPKSCRVASRISKSTS